MESRNRPNVNDKNSNIMTNANTAYYLQGIFWTNLGLNMFNVTVFEKDLDSAKEAAERLLEQHIDELSLTINEKDRIKRERKAENEVLMRGFKDTLKQAGKLVG